MNVLVELQCSFLKTYCPAIFNNRELVTKSDKEYFVFKNNEFLSTVFATELGAALMQQIMLNPTWEHNENVIKGSSEILVTPSLCSSIISINYRGDQTKEECLAKGQQYRTVVYLLNKAIAAVGEKPFREEYATVKIMQHATNEKGETVETEITPQQLQLAIPKQTEPVATIKNVVEIGERSILRVPMCDELPISIKSLTMLMNEQLPKGSWGTETVKLLKKTYGLHQAFNVKGLVSVHSETHYYFCDPNSKDGKRMSAADNIQNDKFWRMIKNDNLGTGMLFLFKDEVVALLNKLNIDVSFVELKTILPKFSNFFWAYLYDFGAVEFYAQSYRFTEDIVFLCDIADHTKLDIKHRVTEHKGNVPTTPMHKSEVMPEVDEFFAKIARLCSTKL